MELFWKKRTLFRYKTPQTPRQTTPFIIHFEKVAIQLEKVVIRFEILVHQFEKDAVPFEIIRIQLQKDETQLEKVAMQFEIAFEVVFCKFQKASV